MLTNLGRLFGQNQNNQGNKRRTRLTRPSLESLEDRLVPSGTFTWKGGTAGAPNDWATAANWIPTGGPTVTYPGQNNSNSEIVFFDNTATTDAYLTTNVTLQQLTLASNFTQKFEVQGGKTLFFQPVASARFFTMHAGTLNLRGGASIVLDAGGAGIATWDGGDINSAGEANAQIYVCRGTGLTITNNATTLGATLIIGQGNTGADSIATVNLATDTQGLASNLTLSKNAGIQVKPKGILNLNQTDNSDTKGGIVNGVGSTGEITNEGKVVRLADTDTTKFLTIGPKFTNSANTSVFEFKQAAKVDFVNKFILQKGKVIMPKDSSGNGIIDKPPGGTGIIQVTSAGTTGNYSVSWLGDALFEGGGGGIVFDNSVAGAWGSFSFGQEFELAAGDYLTVNVDGSTTNVSDSILVGGQFALNGGTLNVNTENASPPPKYSYVVVYYDPLQYTGSGWNGAPVNFGYAASYYFPNGHIDYFYSE